MMPTPRFDRANLKAYVAECGRLANGLYDVIERTAAEGLRPIVLVPSRGAIPVFLLARKFVNAVLGDESPLGRARARYFPPRAFDYLEGDELTPTRALAEGDVDVLLFSFTADVTRDVGDDEALAPAIRASCARSVVAILTGNCHGSLDFQWHMFLSGRLKPSANVPPELAPEAAVRSLESFTADRPSQFILVDAAISGRAAQDITGALAALRHTAVPLLAVDNTNGGKFDMRRYSQISRTFEAVARLMPSEGPCHEVPLITEDMGPALLGAHAVNLADFNEPHPL